MKIFINNIPFYVNPNISIYYLKEIFTNDPINYIVYYNDDILDDDKTLLYYNIYDNSYLQILNNK